MKKNKAFWLKKFTSAILVMVFAVSGFPAVNVHAYDEINVTIDGIPVQFVDQAPTNVNGRVLVPIRGVFEQLGFYVEWDGDTEQATLTSENFTVVVTVGSVAFKTNGASHTLDVPAQIINGRTMLPIRHVLESVGYTVGWNESTRTVLITTDDTTPQPLPTPESQYSPISIPSTSVFVDTVTFNNVPTRIYLCSSRNEYHTICVDTGIIDFFLPGWTLPGTQPTPEPRGDLTHLATNLSGRTLLSQTEIQNLIAIAPSRQETRPSPHPNRAMTDAELQAWIAKYRFNGGLNSFELQALYDLNNFFAEEGIVAAQICPQLSMAARLMAQLSAEYGGSRNQNMPRTAHSDPFYGTIAWRVRLFEMPAGSRYTSTTWGHASDEVIAWGGGVRVFRNLSPSHWATLTARGRVVGIGKVDGVFVIKTGML